MNYEAAIIRASKYRGPGGVVAAFRGITGINPYAYQAQAKLSSPRPALIFCANCGDRSVQTLTPVCKKFDCVAQFNRLSAYQRADYLRHAFGQILWLTMLNFEVPYD